VKEKVKKPSFGLIGGTGNFGRFVRRIISPWASAVVWSRRLGDESFKKILNEKIIVFSIPAHALKDVLLLLKGKIKKDVVLVDLSSVKIFPEKIIHKYFPENPFLSLHPLFGPESAKNGVKDLPVIVCKKGNNKIINCIIKLISEKLKVKLINMTAEEHDKQMAYVQGLSHFISAGLKRLNLPKLDLRTKSFDHLMQMYKILHKSTDDLFKTIEKANPYAKKIRKSFLNILFSIDKELNGRKR